MTPTSKSRPPFRLLVDVPHPPRVPLRFLEPEAAPDRRIRAFAANQQGWFLRNARASGGGLYRINGAACVYKPGPNSEVTLSFPHLSNATAGATLDALLAFCRQRPLRQVSCWSLLPIRPRDLGARLAARGFEWGWQPHWMGLALGKLPADFSLPEGLHIAVEDECDWEVEDLPYYSRENAAALQALVRARPRRIWRFGAWREGKIVGHCALLLTTGRMGVAGLYDVGVVPAARKQGIGRAVTLAACQFAQALGCHHALLNSAASEFYAKLGFESLGWGQTWWMHAPALAAPLPTSEQVAFLEAVGRGDLQALSAFEGQTLPLDLDAPLPCGTTPIGLAAHSRQPASAQWLTAQGATLEIGHAWELGWKDRIPRMLADSPELANRRFGSWQITPLHAAVERGDIELVRLLLTAHPDPDIQDTQFHSTPLGWAHHFGRTEIIALLEEYQATRKECS